jgi:hypothetical protein
MRRMVNRLVHGSVGTARCSSSVGAVNEGEDEGISYYRWTGTELELLRFVRSEKMGCAPGK